MVALSAIFSSCSPPLVDEIFTDRFFLSTFFTTPDSSLLELAIVPVWADVPWVVDDLSCELVVADDWLDGLVVADDWLDGLVVADDWLDGLVVDDDDDLSDGLVADEGLSDGIVDAGDRLDGFCDVEGVTPTHH